MDTCFYDGKTGKPADSIKAYRRALGDARFEQIEKLRAEVAKVLAKYRLLVIDEAVGVIVVPGLRADPEVLAGGRLRVRDAFFFRCL